MVRKKKRPQKYGGTVRTVPYDETIPCRYVIPTERSEWSVSLLQSLSHGGGLWAGAPYDGC